MSKKRIILIILTIILAVILFSFIVSLGTRLENSTQKEDNKLTIVTTLFPQYDFTRQIAGEKVDVTLLLPPGIESHSYEPTPSDIIKISEADVFIYTGENMETWAHSIIDGLEKVEVLDVSEGISLSKIEEDTEEHDKDHHHDYDPHIWTNPIYAITMCRNIEAKLCNIDPKNADYYKENADNYIMQLQQIDEEIRQIVQQAKRKEIIFGSKFPFYYFAQEYGLTYQAAYDSCGEEAEPSAKVVSSLIDKIRKDKIPVIYYEELTEPKIAKTISEQTGVKMLLFHSAHNVSSDDFKKGITYIDIIKQNIENLKEGLN